MTCASRIATLGVLFFLPITGLNAQDSGAARRAPVISAIEIDRQNVFDSTEARGWFARLANHLHVVTRAGVIRRELLFHAGQPYDSGLVAESARNLRALGIFRDVQIDTIARDSGQVIRVTTRDGWTTALDISFESTGDQVTWSTEYFETNLIGTGSALLLKYAKDVDRSATEFEFVRPRLIAGSIGAQLYYEHRSDGHQYIVGLSRPFMSLAAPFGADVSFSDFGGRLFRFANGNPVARDTVERLRTLGVAHAATALSGSGAGYTRLGVTLQVQRDDAIPESVTVFPRTVNVAVGPSLEWRRARYVVTRSFEHLGATEDVDLSATVRADLLAAPSAFGYQHDGVGPSLSVRLGVPMPLGFAFVEGHANGIISAQGVDSGTAYIAGTAIARPGAGRHRIVLHAERSWAKSPAIGSDFDLGFGYGPRAFRAHAFTGDQSWLTTAEYRFTLSPDLGKLAGVALAAFADAGGAWFNGSPPRHGTDFGIGLRLGPTRQADLRTLRIDVARRVANDAEPSGWVLVVGKGFTFRTAQ